MAARIERWDLSEVGADAIVAAAALTYRQARRRGRRAFAGDDPVALHALRARVVDLRYQLALLSCAWPAALNAQGEALNDLREALGDFNDLHVLETFAGEHGKLAPPALEDLRARVEAKQQKLRRRAESEFERLFAEKPRAFTTRIAAYLGNPVIEPGRACRRQLYSGSLATSIQVLFGVTQLWPEVDRRRPFDHGSPRSKARTGHSKG